MASATERWSEESFAKNPNNAWVSVRTFDVINAANEQQVYSATLASSITGLVPVFNEQHNGNAALLAANLSVNRPGFNLWRLEVRYTIPLNGDSHKDEEDPFALPLDIRWQKTGKTDTVDRDVDGNPLTNSAADPFASGWPKRSLNRILFVTRNEPFYDESKAQIYENMLNEETFTIAGAGSWVPGRVRCNSIVPTQTYTNMSEYISIQYEFEIGEDFQAFFARFLDEGIQAVVNADGTRARIYDKNNNKVTSPVRLAGDGTTFETTWKAGHGVGQTQVPIDNPPGTTHEFGLQVLPSAVYLNYINYNSIPFSGLGLV